MTTESRTSMEPQGILLMRFIHPARPPYKHTSQHSMYMATIQIMLICRSNAKCKKPKQPSVLTLYTCMKWRKASTVQYIL